MICSAPMALRTVTMVVVPSKPRPELLRGGLILRHLDVLAHVAFGVHQGNIVVVRNVAKLVLIALHDRLREASGRGCNRLELLAVEDVNASEGALGSAVLSDLGLGKVHDLARA